MIPHASRSSRLTVLVTLTMAVLLGGIGACGGGGDDSTRPTATRNGGDTGAANPTPTAVSSGATDVASGVNACGLLTQAEVEEALGGPATAPQPGASGPFETCTWNTQDVSLKFVIVQVHGDVTREEFLTERDQTAAFLKEDVAGVDGVGDAAYDLGGFLYAHQGAYELVLTNILGLNADVPAEAAQALEINTGLMQKALARLP